ncbi:Leucyl-cystinyl aminopeptidase [Papilio machaon]|uniref:Leucyl-cystinyl aminopeptidase n=1 Tax=Papilio machaon TaxID=76193 RepID=A0A0N1IIN5_PAPMA|nr:Leucyl-cystinyl aminopeptidase [Papilio machaon]
MNVTERALFKSGGSLGPKIVKTLDYPPADQTYIEFKEKLRRKFNYTLSLRFITKLGKGDKQRGFFLTGTHRRRCAVSRFWLTHARSAFPCLDEPHLRATFKLTIVRDRFHVSLTNMPIVATEEAGFYLGHRLLQDEFAQSPPISPHMISLAVCRLQRRAAPLNTSDVNPESEDVPTEISLYSDQETILNESGPLLEWVQRTIQLFSYELNTSYPLPKFDIVVVDGSNPYSEGWGLIILDPVTLTDTKIIAKLIAQQWFGGLVSPRWWSSQWLMEALTSVLSEKATPLSDATAEREEDALLLDHVLPALRLDSSYSVRAVANPRLERADIETTAEELSLHKGAAIVSMAIEAAGEAAGRAALARLLRDHRFSSTDARDLWRSLQRNGTDETPAHAWDGWCDKAGYPLLSARISGPDVIIRQERFVMSAEPPDPEPVMMNSLLTMDLRADLDELFYEPENYTEIIEEDINATTTTPQPTTTTKRTTIKTTKAPPLPKWVIPVTFSVARLSNEHHWAPWRVVLTHLSWWKELLRLSASAPHLNRLLSQLHPDVQVYTQQQIEAAGLTEDQLWLSGALLMAGVEWENENITNQALDLFDAWFERNETIPEIYQEAALVAGVRSRGAVAWHRVWRELLSQTSHSIRAAKLLPALAAPDDDWLFYRPRDIQNSKLSVVVFGTRWRGAAGVWRVVSRAGALPPGALQAAARCLHHPTDYWRFKELFGEERGAAAALDTIALNSAWVPRADSDLLRYFKAVRTL